MKVSLPGSRAGTTGWDEGPPASSAQEAPQRPLAPLGHSQQRLSGWVREPDGSAQGAGTRRWAAEPGRGETSSGAWDRPHLPPHLPHLRARRPHLPAVPRVAPRHPARSPPPGPARPVAAAPGPRSSMRSARPRRRPPPPGRGHPRHRAAAARRAQWSRRRALHAYA